jgi:tripartite-type tricarboxylate transporter receptor subunit TctC
MIDERRRLLVLGGLAAAMPLRAQAQGYPTRPIRLVVPAAAGGAADRYARLIGQRLSEALEQPVVVDNRPGAAGNIGAGIVAKSPPDGYTLLSGHNAIFGTNPHVYKSVPFDPLRDFVAVAPIVKGYMYLFVPGSSPAGTLKEFIALAMRNPGALNYGSGGIGGITHLAMESLKHETGIDVVHIPYKGGTPEVIRALIGGDLAAAFEFYTPVMAQARAGRLKVLGITSLKRNPAVPDIPTFAEQGVTGFEHYGWTGIFAPAGTPKHVVDRLNTEVSRARASPEVQKTIQDAGAIEMKGAPDEFAALVRQEYERGAKLVKLAGATLE